VFVTCFSSAAGAQLYRKFAGKSESGPHLYLFPEVRKSLCIFRPQLSNMEISKAPKWLREADGD